MCQQHRLAVIQPNNGKSVPAAPVPAGAKMGHPRGDIRTLSEERIDYRGSHVIKQESLQQRSRGGVGVPHQIRRKSQGRNQGKSPELGEWRTVFAREKRQEKRVVRKTARMKHQATRVRRQQQDQMLGTFNVRTTADKGVAGIDANRSVKIGIQETK